MTEVILVDEHDEPVGTMEKMEVHRKGLLHRAFSVFIFNSKGEMLLQQRAKGKYHNGGLWTNSCCSHPEPGEDILNAANRRLQQEMGFSTLLSPAFTFTYNATFDNGLTEYEYDHVFTGIYDGQISINENEVSDYCFKTMADINSSVTTHPHKYTQWFKLAFEKVKLFHKNNFVS